MAKLIEDSVSSKPSTYLEKNAISSISNPLQNMSTFSGVMEESKFFASRVYHRLGKGFHQRFEFNQQRYGYFHHRYNMTWRGERAVEIPIVWDWLQKKKTARVLEVGNVLSHYFPVTHDIVDKYEGGERITECDVLDFRASAPYDLIVSISTFEHIGFDEEQKSPDKPLRSLQHLFNTCLNPGGTIVITFPLGHNPDLDRAALEGNSLFPNISFLKRVSRSNIWRQVSATEVAGCRYGDPFPLANGLAVAILQSPDSTRTTAI